METVQILLGQKSQTQTSKEGFFPLSHKRRGSAGQDCRLIMHKVWVGGKWNPKSQVTRICGQRFLFKSRGGGDLNIVSGHPSGNMQQQTW